MVEALSNALIVEDEPELGGALQIALRRLGALSISRVSTIDAARGACAASSPELILLDRNLPDGDGIHLCSELRSKGFTGTILMLTAAGDTQSRISGLNAGADDYLPKPFSWAELEARIRALLRRRGPAPVASAPADAPSVAETLWTCDEARLRIFGPRGWIELTPLEYKLATHLMNAGGAIVSREELLKNVWGFTLLPKTRTVDHFLGRLRKHFELDAENPKHFMTIRGAGYRFEG